LESAKHLRSYLKQPEETEFPREQSEGVGARGNVTENPRGDLDIARWMKAQMALQTDAFLKAITTLTANQGPAAAVDGPVAPAAAQGVQMAQNTQELSLTTPVLFYGRSKDGKTKRVPDGAQSKTNQTRVGAQYLAAFCQILPEGRGCFMGGRLHLVIRV
jgi:hypothetical protein